MPSCREWAESAPRAHPSREGPAEEARRRDAPCDYCGSLESKAELARRGAAGGWREGAGWGGARWGVVPVPQRGAKSVSTSLFSGPAPRESEFSGKVSGRILGAEC